MDLDRLALILSLLKGGGGISAMPAFIQASGSTGITGKLVEIPADIKEE